MLDYTALSRISAFVMPLERFPVKYFEAIAVDLWGLWPFALIVTVIIIALLLLTLAPCGQKKLGRPVSSKARICGALCRSRDLIPVLVPKETPSVDADICRAICIIFSVATAAGTLLTSSNRWRRRRGDTLKKT